jgi:protein TonB
LIKKVELPSDLESGLVCLEGTIGTDGVVRDLRIVRSGGPKLDRIALETVKKWRYQPAALDGVPVPVPLAFTLRVQHHYER